MEAIVGRIAAKHQISKAAAKELVKTFLEEVVTEVVTVGRVSFIGFGTFERVDKAARNSYNPKDKKIVVVPATTLPKFKAGSKFKEAVKGEVAKTEEVA